MTKENEPANKSGVGIISFEALLGNEEVKEVNPLMEQIEQRDKPDTTIADALGLGQETFHVIPSTSSKEEALTPTVIEETEEEVVPEPEKPEQANLRELTKKILGPEYNTIEQEIGGEIVSTSIDDIELDEELVVFLINQKHAKEKEESLVNKIGVDGISEITKAIIDIDKNGGDISKVIELQEKFVTPFSNIDTSTNEGRKEVILMNLKAQGNNERNAKLLLRGFEAEGTVDEEFEQADAELKAALAYYIEQEKSAAQAKADNRKEALKAFKQEAKKVTKETFDLKDTAIDKIVNSLTKEGANGRFEITNLIEEALSNPSKAVKLALLLLDENEYEAQISRKKVVEKQISTLSTLNLTRRSANPVEATIEANKQKTATNYIDLNNL